MTPGGGEYLYRDNGVEGKHSQLTSASLPHLYFIRLRLLASHLDCMTNKLTFYLFYSTLYNRILDCYWNIECNDKDEHLW